MVIVGFLVLVSFIVDVSLTRRDFDSSFFDWFLRKKRVEGEERRNLLDVAVLLLGLCIVAWI